MLKVEGKWSSPGGEKKLFISDKVTLTWLRNKKYLPIRGKDERKVTYLVLSKLCGKPKEDRATNQARVETVAIQQCRSNDLVSECEGTKLELILESRVNRRIQENVNSISKLKCEFSDITKSVACMNQEKLSGDSRDNANVQVGEEEGYSLYGDKFNSLLDLCNVLQTNVHNHKEDLTTTLHLSRIKLAELSTSLKFIKSKVEGGKSPMGSTTATQTESESNRTNYSLQVQSSLITATNVRPTIENLNNCIPLSDQLQIYREKQAEKFYSMNTKPHLSTQGGFHSSKKPYYTYYQPVQKIQSLMYIRTRSVFRRPQNFGMRNDLNFYIQMQCQQLIMREDWQNYLEFVRRETRT